MVYFTGDIHADLDPERSKIFSRLEADDVLIVLGDFGFSWNEMTEKLWNSYEFPFITLTLLGNHENYDRVYETYPLTAFAGGEAYRINRNTYYAKNGTMYTIAGEKMLCFGGARSIDAVYRTPPYQLVGAGGAFQGRLRQSYDVPQGPRLEVRPPFDAYVLDGGEGQPVQVRQRLRGPD